MLINLSEQTLPHVVQKTLDISSKVRTAVFKKLLTAKCPLVKLKDKDKCQLIVNGLKDHDHDVVQYCKDYLS